MAKRSQEPLRLSYEPSVAYFSMEIAVADNIPTYCGGLGVLAGDHLRAAADAELPLIGVTLLYRSGYFHQIFDENARQIESPVEWSPEHLLELLAGHVMLELSGRQVKVVAWRHWIVGYTGFRVPVLFLDTAVEDNDERDRAITDRLYGGDQVYRLLQEAVLGMGGTAMLANLGVSDIPTFHMNEGHSSLLTVSLLMRLASRPGAPTKKEMSAVRERCVFTTHTPVPEGHDRFDADLVNEVLGSDLVHTLSAMGGLRGGELNMTVLGMSFSRFVNAVSLRHCSVSRRMFPQFAIDCITNGVHAQTWVCPSMARLFDRHLNGWREHNSILRYASDIPVDELKAAHEEAKASLVAMVAARSHVVLDPSRPTLCVARRAAPYKRLDLLLSDPEEIKAISRRHGPLQIVYSGKAHPSDREGKAVITRILHTAEVLGGAATVVYLEDYSLALASILCAGADVWVNTPEKPYEASGTSGMKAALNGVPSLSVLDGWWLEGDIEGVTGWSVGDDRERSDRISDSAALYRKLDTVILPLFYDAPDDFVVVGRSAIAMNGSYFTTERMVHQYASRAYWPGRAPSEDSD